MLKTLLITLLIVAICIALLSVKILFKKNGRFPNTHVSGSKAMRKEASDACNRKTVKPSASILTPFLKGSRQQQNNEANN